jgi:hypothetical protein
MEIHKLRDALNVTIIFGVLIPLAARKKIVSMIVNVQTVEVDFEKQSFILVNLFHHGLLHQHLKTQVKQM